MQMVIWAGVILFAFVLAYNEAVLAKATLRVLQREGSTGAEEQPLAGGRRVSSFLFAVSLCFCFALDLLLVYTLCGGG